MQVENLALEIDVDPASVYNWLRGSTRPTIDRAYSILAVAARFGTKLTLDDIYRRDIENNDEEKTNGVLSRATPQTGNRRLATAQE